MTYLEIIDKIDERNLEWEPVHDIICDALEILAKYDKSAYNDIIDELEDYALELTKEDAQKIVRTMKPRGEVWSCDTIQNFLMTKGINEEIVKWYLVMNMVYNDYYDTALKYNLQDDNEFYFSIAKDFIMDPDAKKHKVEKYFMV